MSELVARTWLRSVTCGPSSGSSLHPIASFFPIGSLFQLQAFFTQCMGLDVRYHKKFPSTKKKVCYSSLEQQSPSPHGKYPV